MWAGALSVFNWITQVAMRRKGWPRRPGGLALAAKAGLHASLGRKVSLIMSAAAVQLVLPLLGHGTILRVQRLLVGPFVVLFMVLAVLTLPKVHLAAGAGAKWETMTVALALMLSSGGYGWPINASYFSRYLHPQTSRRTIVGAVALGGYIASTLLSLLGAAVATTVRSASDPISGLPTPSRAGFSFPTWSS